MNQDNFRNEFNEHKKDDKRDEFKEKEFKNKTTLEVKCNDEPRKITSNEVEAKKIEVRLIQFEDVHLVFEGDIITYTTKICNDSCVDLYDAEFEDCIPNGLCYEHCSFKVNGDEKTPRIKGQNLSFIFKKLEKESETTVCFKVKVK